MPSGCSPAASAASARRARRRRYRCRPARRRAMAPRICAASAASSASASGRRRLSGQVRCMLIKICLQDDLRRDLVAQRLVPARADARIGERGRRGLQSCSARRPARPAAEASLRAGARIAARARSSRAACRRRASASPTTSSAGCHSSISAAIAAKRVVSRSAAIVASGCARPSVVSPTATPMRRVPKSNASMVPARVAGRRHRSPPRVTHARRRRTAAKNRCPAASSPPAGALGAAGRTSRRDPPRRSARHSARSPARAGRPPSRHSRARPVHRCGPSPRPTASRMSFEVVRPSSSLIASVDCQLPSGRCSTKPRSICTGPPKCTGAARRSASPQRNLICSNSADKRHVDRPVDHDAERALFVVLADVGQRLREMRIGHAGHGDQEVMGQIDPRFTHAAASAG